MEFLAHDHVMAATTASHTPHTPLDEYMRTKQAMMAAQCYVLSMKLMASISGQVLQDLLTTPMLDVQSSLFRSTSPEAAARLSDQEGEMLQETSRVSETLTLGGLFVSPAGSFQHALRATVDMIDVGSRLLGRMEQLLKLPSDLGSGSASSTSLSAEQGVVDLPQGKPSLPARLVATIWEDEAHVNKKWVVTYFRRCRAAILGLLQHNL